MNFSLSDIFFVLVIFQLALISLFLFSHQRGRRISNFLLAFFFLAICLNLADSFLVLKGAWQSSAAWVGWGICLPLLFGPLLYLYTQSVLYKNFSVTKTRWLHLLPFFIGFLLSEWSYLSLDHDQQIELIGRILERKVPVTFYWSSAAIFLQFFVYVWASMKLINRYKRMASNQFSDQQRNNISWLSSTILFFTVCMILAALNGFTSLTPFAKYYYFILTLLVLLIFIFINRILLKALKEPEIFSIMEEGDRGAVPRNETQPAAALPGPEKQKSLEVLKKHMEEKKPWLEPELSLEQLAGQLSMRPKVLSQLINESLKQNFFDFVNRYRIDEAKRLLTNPEDKKITVLEVLYEVGFNSKSSFNTLFKKHTGLTPSEFKKKHLQP